MKGPRSVHPMPLDIKVNLPFGEVPNPQQLGFWMSSGVSVKVQESPVYIYNEKDMDSICIY